MITGSCLCGEVRWQTERSPKVATNCYCSMCRKSHGAAFSTYAAVRRDRLQVTGEPKRYRSSDTVVRSFCGTCGSSLFFESEDDARVVWIALGSADGDPGVRPSMHMYVGSKAPWVEITDALPQYEGIPT